MSAPSNTTPPVVNVKPVDPKIVNSRIDGVLESLNALTSDDLDQRIKALDAQRASLTTIRNALSAKERALSGPCTTDNTFPVDSAKFANQKEKR